MSASSYLVTYISEFGVISSIVWECEKFSIEEKYRVEEYLGTMLWVRATVISFIKLESKRTSEE